MKIMKSWTVLCMVCFYSLIVWSREKISISSHKFGWRSALALAATGKGEPREAYDSEGDALDFTSLMGLMTHVFLLLVP
jgi:hypothetical protein